MREQGEFDSNKHKSFAQRGPIRCINGRAVVEAGNPDETFRVS